MDALIHSSLFVSKRGGLDGTTTKRARAARARGRCTTPEGPCKRYHRGGECLPTHHNSVLSAISLSDLTRYEGEQTQPAMGDRAMLPRRMAGVSRGLPMPVELS